MLNRNIQQSAACVKGATVYLRLVTLEDCTSRYLNWLRDPDVNKLIETRWTPQTLETIKRYVSEVQDGENNFLFAICRNDDDLHLGNIKVGPINRYHGYADVSYFLGEKKYWGRGIASEAIGLAVRFAFETLSLRALFAGVAESNIGSCKALLHNGFALAGTFKERFFNNVEGRYEDAKHYWLLKSDWLNARRLP